MNFAQRFAMSDNSYGTGFGGGENICDLVDKAGVTWGWFQGGFSNPGYVSSDTSTYNQSQVCTGTSQNIPRWHGTNDRRQPEVNRDLLRLT